MQKYKKLKSFYYQYGNDNEQEYLRRFHSSDAILFKFRVGPYPAFIMQTAGLYKQALEIQILCREIDALSASLPDAALKQYRSRCLVEEVLYTNHIEGVYSTRAEIGTVLERVKSSYAGSEKSKKRRRPVRFESVVRKYYMLDSNVDVPLNTSIDVRNLYDDMMLNEALREDPDSEPDGNVFRKGKVYLTNGLSRYHHEGVTPEAEIVKQMDYALEMLSDKDIEILFRVSIFHYIFGYIHPFYEGNGRMSRFISSYVLSKKIQPLIGYRLSRAIAENRDRYYKAFRTCNDPLNRGDVTPFVISFLGIVKTTCKTLAVELRELSERFSELNKKLEKYMLDFAQNEKELYRLLLQAALFSDIGISTSELCELAGISRTTLAKRLKKINERNDLETTLITQSKYYKLKLENVSGIEVE